MQNKFAFFKKIGLTKVALHAIINSKERQMHTITVGQKQPNTKYDFVENCFGIIEQNNQLLLVKQKGQHSFIGGRIEKGESQEQCLKREFLEESGLTITKIIPLCTLIVFGLQTANGH